MAGKENPIGRHLLLSTISFAICFALWGLVGALGPIFRETYGLSGTQAALLVVVPVLLGSLARIPPDVHHEAITYAMVDAPTDLLGMLAGSCAHFPVGLRMGSIRIGSR